MLVLTDNNDTIGLEILLGNVVACGKPFTPHAIQNVRYFSHAVVNNTPTCSSERIPR